MVRLERNEESMNTVKAVSSTPVMNSSEILPPAPELREEVDFIIEQGMTDLWLLLTGEGLGALPYRRNRDGQAFARTFDGQMHLLGSKLFALDALRSVGLDLAMEDAIYEG